MRAYLITTSAIFGLLVVVHIWRMVVEAGVSNPWFLGITVLAAAMCGWALSLLRHQRDAPRA